LILVAILLIVFIVGIAWNNNRNSTVLEFRFYRPSNVTGTYLLTFYGDDNQHPAIILNQTYGWSILHIDRRIGNCTFYVFRVDINAVIVRSAIQQDESLASICGDARLELIKRQSLDVQPNTVVEVGLK
jgi:hypothetical protein